MIKNLTPPSTQEYHESYSEYIERARNSDVLSLLPAQIGTLHLLLDDLTNEQACYRFGPSEWSVKQLVGHLGDVERVFSYRLLRISRNDTTSLPGFDQNVFVEQAGFDDRSLTDLLHEFEFLRQASILLVNGLTDEMALRLGTASGFRLSARALIYMLPGHVEHHLESLRKNYLAGIRGQ